jgi:acyl-coenzyme A synthetase/AMP-(fatty) acid ligase
MLLEERRYAPDPEFARQANAQSDIYERDWEEFWETEGRNRVTWFEPFSKLYEWEPPYAKWYLGGKLNVCFNCVDRHVEGGNGDRVAYFWEGEPEEERRTITFADLQREVVRSVGEPINPEAWIWYREHIGGDRTPIVDTWWQTETGMILITPLPGVTTTKPGSATKPFPGVDAGVYSESGEEVGPGGGGYLVLKRPWPAMLRGIYKDDQRFRDTYWSKYDDVYFAGDGARIDEDGDFWLLGRVDDVMNISGHRISTIEVESALVDHKKVAEAAVCGRKDERTGQAIVAYVTLKGGDEGSIEMLEELRNHVAKKIGPIAKPANIVFTPELPKTRSGKIMRRLLRDVAEERALGDTTTLADPAVVEEIKERATADARED